ncbi:M28 family peptidase [Terrarubrum flagellatum]|uniref:M28 family peptidase n=1 Tax=Terrirubrum flagellatum TaxID=2895980 RepID=UPI00314516ED
MTLEMTPAREGEPPVAAVSSARMMADLQQLARWTKLAATPTEAESLAFVRSRFDDAGFKTGIIEHDAYISIPGPAHVMHGAKRITAITHSMAVSSPASGLVGEVVDVGEGEEADFADKTIAGRIVLADGIASPGVALRASRAGAVGVVQVSPHHLLHEMCISPIWGSPSSQTKHDLPTVLVVTISEEDGAALRQEMAKGALRLTLHASVDTGWRKTPLLVAELPAPDGDKDAPFVLLSGHHDTWFEGVMDNGAANVATIEVARICAEHQKQWKRGLRVCVWSGHSQGRYSGSAWYVDQHWSELNRRCVAHVNVDSLGAVGAEVLNNAAAAGGLFDIAAAAIKIESGQTLNSRRKARSADDSFPGVGIPSVFGSLSYQPPSEKKMRNDLGWWWHTAHDLIDKISPDNLARDTRIVLRIVWGLLADRILPIDYLAQAKDFERELAKLVDKLGGRFPLCNLREAAMRLSAALTTLRAEAASLPADKVNGAIQRLSRIMVPLDYTKGDRFVHDAALSLSPWPALDALRNLAQATPGTDDARFAEVDAVRAANRVLFALSQAEDAARAAFA